jgi:hypothetical protein
MPSYLLPLAEAWPSAKENAAENELGGVNKGIQN